MDTYIGKTYLISFICQWLGSPLVNLDVHGGTTEQDIIETFERAQELVKHHREAFVFLDECNTCPHMVRSLVLLTCQYMIRAHSH